MSFVLYNSKRAAHKFNQLKQTVVDPDAIAAYLDKPKKDHDYVKDYDRGNVLRKLPPVQFVTRPRLHQLHCFFLTTYFRSLLLFLDMGGGKTKVMLDTIRFRKEHHGMKKVLVLTLNIVSAYTWLDEVAKHAPDLRCVVLHGSRQQREQQLLEEADLYVSNFHVLLLLLCNRVTDRKRNKKGKFVEDQWQFSQAKLNKLVKQFDTLMVDEVHMLSNIHGHLWQLASKLAAKMRFRYGLTGTPFGKDPLPLFAEFKLIDRGETFGDKIGMFKAAFYSLKKMPFGARHVFDKQMKPDLQRMMKNRSITYLIDEFADLPPITKQVICIRQSDQMRAKHEEIIKVMGDARSMIPIENLFVNLRQCTSGYQTLKYRGPEIEGVLDSTTREFIDFTSNPKLDALEGLIQSLPEDEKIIIFVEYIHSLDLVRALLSKMKVVHQTLYGKTKDKAGALKRFYTDTKCRILLGNNVSISTGINPQEICHYAIYFETSVRPIIRQQSERRLHREGQKWPVFLYDLVVEESIDDKIAKALKEGRDLLQDLLAKPRQAKLLFERKP